MDIKSLQEWLRQSRQAGLSDVQIREQLQSSGWTDQQVTDLFSGDMFRQGQLEAVGATKKEDFDTMAGLAENQMGTGGTLPGFGDVLKETWELYKSRIANFIIIAIIAAILGTLLAAIFMFVTGVGLFGLASSFGILNGQNTTGAGSIVGWFAGFIPLILAISFAYAWIQAALMLTITNRDISVGTTLKQSFRYMMRYWWLTVLMGFFVGGATMLFIIPGIIISIWFSFGFFILLTEELRGTQALLKSKEYIRGYWWKIFLYGLGVSLMLSIPLIALNLFLSRETAGAISVVIQPLLSLLMTPFLLCFSYNLYLHMKGIKGKDISVPQKKAGLIITAILGWLMIPVIVFGIGGLTLGGAKSKAMDATRQSDIQRVYAAALSYYDDNKSYPNTVDELAPKYLASIPTDPKTREPYAYALTSDRKNFSLCARLNNKDLTGTKEYCQWSQIAPSNYPYNSNTQ
ncbi:MAG: hypothetical protein V1668_01750 [Patescibacteria group bacterium]